MSKKSRNLILNEIKKGLSNSSHVRDKNLFPTDKTRDLKSEFRQIIQGNREVRDHLLKQFINEAESINITVKRLGNGDKAKHYIQNLTKERGISSFSIWESDYFKEIGLKKHLKSVGLSVITAGNKDRLAKSEIGITEADYAIADMGTLVLLADRNKPRSISLLPPVHLAVVKNSNIIKDIGQLFVILKNSLDTTKHLTNCINFITGPSRTADIELSLTLGVHGPKELIIIILDHEQAGIQQSTI